LIVNIFTSTKAFKAACLKNQNANFLIFDIERLHPHFIEEIDSLTKLCRMNDIFADKAIQKITLKDLNYFFLKVEDLGFWYLAFTSKVPLSIPNYLDIQKLFMLNAFTRKWPSKSVLVFCSNRDLKYQIEKIILSKHIRLPFLIIASPIVFLKYLRLLLRVFFNNTYKKIKVNSVFFTLQSLNSTSGKDTYFGLLPKKLSEFSDVLIVYLASGWKIRLRNTKKSAPIESFIGVLNSLLLFKSLFFIRLPFSKSFIKSPFNDSFSNNIFVYLVSKEIKQGIFHQHIFLETAIREMLKKISLNVISYPFENRSWEKLLVFEAKNAGIQKIIGYQHSSITPRHLSFKINSQCIINHYLPSKILTCGHVTFNWLKKNSYLIKSILVKGVSFRIIEKKISAASKESLLVALSSSKSEAFRILYIVSQISKSLDLPIVIRAHPTINLSDLIKKFSFSNKITISNSSLEFDIRNATMVAYSSSTVALEAMLHGRFPVFFDIGDVPTGDPILGHLDYNRNVKSLKDFLFFYNWKLGLSSFELRKFRQILISSSNDYLVAPIDKRSSYLLWI